MIEYFTLVKRSCCVQLSDATNEGSKRGIETERYLRFSDREVILRMQPIRSIINEFWRKVCVRSVVCFRMISLVCGSIRWILKTIFNFCFSTFVFSSMLLSMFQQCFHRCFDQFILLSNYFQVHNCCGELTIWWWLCYCVNIKLLNVYCGYILIEMMIVRGCFNNKYYFVIPILR